MSALSHAVDLLWTGIQTQLISAAPLVRLFPVCPLEGTNNKFKIQNKLRPFNV